LISEDFFYWITAMTQQRLEKKMVDSFHSFYCCVFCGSKFCGFGSAQEHAELCFWVDYQLTFFPVGT